MPKRGALFAPLTHRANYHHLSSSERLEEIMKQNFEWISDTEVSVDSQRDLRWRCRILCDEAKWVMVVPQ
jgi:hypothetical protein